MKEKSKMNVSSTSIIFFFFNRDKKREKRESLFSRSSLLGLYNIKKYFFKVSFLFLRLEGYFC